MRYSISWVIELYAAGKIGRESSNRWLTLHYQRIYANTWTSATRMLCRAIRKTIRNVVRRGRTRLKSRGAVVNHSPFAPAEQVSIPVTTIYTTTYLANYPKGTLITRLLAPNPVSTVKEIPHGE